ncbi:FtsX-like permease family protein [Kribbella sp. NBC_00709]|uniref:ABC transporter permease n=1 Tax=Kribbella sp. NBC_00709 TaxID=2975972 RepID=UPI002E29FE66|nr:FtsX-like permease family protein [Kribbella sp. NBC_00709]
MRAITRKTLRDLRRQWAQAVAVGVTVLLGVMLFIASAGAFRNLDDSYQRTYERLRFADLIATGGDADKVAAAARDAGAVGVTVRTQVDPPMLIEGTKLIGRVVGLPISGQPAVDAVALDHGTYLGADDPDGVLVESHAADTYDLAPGDALQVYAGSGWQTVKVRGIVRSAEYLWPARNRQDVLGDPHAFAVVFADEDLVRRLNGGVPNQVLLRLPAGTDQGAVAAALRTAGATDVTNQADQASNATLHEDLNGFSELSVAFPLLFLTAAAVAAYVLLARKVLAERSVIGTLMAAGARRSRLVRHYLQQGLLIGLFGGVCGAVLGTALTGPLTRGYTGALGIPDTVTRSAHGDLIAIGVAFAALIGLVGAAVPAVTAARTIPAEAMRNETASRPPGRWSHLVAAARWLPVTARMALRDVSRNLRRTLATMLGVVLALILVLTSIGMLTSLSDAISRQYGQIERQDATVSVAAGAGDRLSSVPGVSAAEPIRVGRVTAVLRDRSYATTLTGFRTDTQMHRFVTVDGKTISLPDNGFLAGRGLADSLHVKVGQVVTLTTATASTRLHLVGLLDEPVGTAIYTSDSEAARLLPDSAVSTYLVRFGSGVDRDAMRRTMTALPGVVAYADAVAVTASLDQFLGLFWAFVGTMVVLGAVLAAVIMYVTLAVNIVERTNELATLRAAGVPMRRVAGTIATENLAATTLGLPIGVAAGLLAARAFLGSFSSDLFTFRLTFGWWVVPAAVVAVLAAATLSQWPAVRAVRRLDIARVVRERSR